MPRVTPTPRAQSRRTARAMYASACTASSGTGGPSAKVWSPSSPGGLDQPRADVAPSSHPHRQTLSLVLQVRLGPIKPLIQIGIVAK